MKTTVGAIAAKERKNQRSLRCLAFRFTQQPNMWNKQWKVGHSPASSSTSKACGVKYCELASRVDVGWDVASHCLFSSLGPCILGYVLALGLTFGPAILLFVSLLGLLSCFGPRILVCFLASGLAKLPPFLSCALLCGINIFAVGA